VLELVRKGQRELEAGFMVGADGCWSRNKSSALIGRGRARDIAVNIALPFAFAWAQFSSQPELERYVLELYRCYPKLDENEITREMR
jgi:hypothetical protein